MKILYLTIAFFTLFGYSQTEETIISGDSKLHYKTFGSGKPILIINGGPGMNSDGFAFVAEELTKMNHQAIIYDHRGTGKSIIDNPNRENITMDLMVEDIENLRKHLKIEKWSILGHSFGGIMTTYYASKHPETIDKLIFSSSGGVNLKFTNYINARLYSNLTSLEKDSLNYYQQKRVSDSTNPKNLEKFAHFKAKAYVFDKSKSAQVEKRMTQTNFKINSLVFENLEKINFDCSHSFKDFKQSVLVLQGKNDIITVGTAHEIASTFPNSKLVLMENCGHYGWLEAKELYFNSINKFLNN
jgi:proline iminopeptidase